MQPRLTRTRSDRMIAGVCSGLGHYFGIDPVIVRLIFVVLAVTTFTTPLIYPLLWLIMPAANTPQSISQPTAADSTVRVPSDARFDPLTGQPLSSSMTHIQEQGNTPAPEAAPSNRGRMLGMVLLAIGAIILVNNVSDALRHIFGVDVSGIIFPLLLVAVGVYLLRHKTA